MRSPKLWCSCFALLACALIGAIFSVIGLTRKATAACPEPCDWCSVDPAFIQPEKMVLDYRAHYEAQRRPRPAVGLGGKRK